MIGYSEKVDISPNVSYTVRQWRTFLNQQMLTTYNDESLSRHGVSREDADCVIATGWWFEMDRSERGNTRNMFVGFTRDGRLLEVGVEYFENKSQEHVFHADDATKIYRELYTSSS